MKNKLFLPIVFIMCFCFGLSGYAQIKGIKHIIVFGVDGMSPNGVRHANTPNMNFIMKNGSFTMHGRAVLPTVSSPNWAAIISGAGPMQTGVESNEWEVDDHILPPVVTGSEKIFPTIFRVVRQQMPNAEIGAIYQWDGFGRLFEKSAVNYDVNGKDEFQTTQLVVDYLKAKNPTFTFIHLDLVDDAGHSKGHGSPEYYRAVSIADSLLGIVMQAAKDCGMYESTLFVVCADHGGIGFGHGGLTLDEDEVPFMMYGPGVKKGHELKAPYYQYDNAATLAFAFGLKPPYAWVGRPVKHAFEGFEDPEITNEKNWLSRPVIFPEKHFYSPAGGLYVDKIPEVTIKSEEEGTEIRYTVDGTEPTKQSTLYTGAFNLEQSGVVTAKVFRGDSEESQSEKAYFRVVKSGSSNGLNYSYYEIDSLSFLPAFARYTPVRTGKVYECRIDQIEHRSGDYAIVFEGYIKISNAGKYKFYTLSDDGSKLFIDGKEVVDNDGGHGTLEKSDSVTLTEGMHKIKVTYFDGYGGQWLDVFYRGPGIPKQIVPASVLFLNN